MPLDVVEQQQSQNQKREAALAGTQNGLQHQGHAAAGLDVGAVQGMSTQALEAAWAHPALASPANASMRAAVMGELTRRKGVEWAKQAAREGGAGARPAQAHQPQPEGDPLLDPVVQPDQKSEHSQGAEYKALEKDPALHLKGEGDGAELHRSDVAQGQLGDCYFVAALAALADRNPAAIQNIIKDLGDGTWQVTFKEGTVVVDGTFPLEGGSPVYAGKGDTTGDQVEVWAMLLEKAWAKLKGGYEQVRGSKVQMQSGDAMEALSGQVSTTRYTSSMSSMELLDFLAAADEKKLPMTAGSYEKDRFKEEEIKTMAGQGVYCNHAYSVIEVDRQGGKIKLYNPWGPDSKPPELTIDEFQKYYQNVHVNPK